MKVLVFGAGAVGAYFGGRLAQAGADVSVVGRSDYEEIKKNGFEIKSIKGDFSFMPSQVVRCGAEYQGKADLIIVSSKVLPEINIVDMIKDTVHKNTVIMLAQNGIAIENNVHNAFPDNELWRAVLYIGCTKIAPATLNHSGGLGSITFGKFDGGKACPLANEVYELFKKTPCTVELTENIQYFCWKKLLWNIPFNSISVIGGGLLTGEMTNRGLLEDICRNIMAEIIKVAATQGITLENELIEQNIEYTRSFTPYATSMLADYRRKRPLEVEAIVGNVYRIAAANNVEIPHIATIYALLESVNRKNS